MNLNDYLSHWDKALEGGIYLESYADYLSLNRVRFNRNYKTFKASEEFVKVSQRVSFPTNWIIITEPWCGDAAQSVPVLLRLIEHIPSASYSLSLRDQRSLIDQYLTNGGKGIPKVIVRDEKGNDLLVWGPRTREAQELFNELKAKGVELKELHESLHGWYGKDHGKTLELELLNLIQTLF
jgi:glutaredoxin-related protein